MNGRAFVVFFLIWTALMAPAAMAPAAMAQTSFLVHLPGAPIEDGSQLAKAVNGLAGYLSEQVPDLALQPQIFRRFSDANDYFTANSGSIALMLIDRSFLLDVGADSGLVPTHRLIRGGKGTYRRLLVVKSEDSAEKLVDLKGRDLTVAESAGGSYFSFLQNAVFDGEIVPADWFGQLDRKVDDFTATAEVLYGQADAALIGEHNPLLGTHLGKELRAVYTSPPLSLPVLMVRGATFSGPRRQALEKALAGLGDDPRGQMVLSELRVDGFEALPRGQDFLALPKRAGKALEIALPAAGPLPLELPATPPAGDLPFTLAVDLPDIPLPREEGRP